MSQSASRSPRGTRDFCTPLARGVALPAAALFALLTVGCALPQPAPVPDDAQEAPTQIVVPPPAPECSACEVLKGDVDELRGDIRDLRKRIARTDSALAELGAQRRAQARALDEANRRAARANARLGHLATRASAASYLAEVEVSTASAGLASGATASRDALASAQRALESARRSFDEGDYAAAIDKAGEAEEIVARSQTDDSVRRVGGGGVMSLYAQAVPVRVRVDSHLRRQPGRHGPVRAVLAGGTPLLALAQSGAWIRVETTDGRSGWVYRPLLELR